MQKKKKNSERENEEKEEKFRRENEEKEEKHAGQIIELEEKFRREITGKNRQTISAPIFFTNGKIIESITIYDNYTEQDANKALKLTFNSSTDVAGYMFHGAQTYSSLHIATLLQKPNTNNDPHRVYFYSIWRDFFNKLPF